MWLSVFIPRNDSIIIRNYGAGVFGICFIYSVMLVLLNNQYNFFEINRFSLWLSNNLNCLIGIDTLSALFILLTNLLFLICIISSYSSITHNQKYFIILLITINFFLTCLFSVLDLLYFYICFESILIPMIVLIGVWGSRQRRIHAAFQFFFYTLIGSFGMLSAISMIYSDYFTTNYVLLTNYSISFEKQILVWICLFLAFAIKIPMFPFHIWLPEAHVEAPTIGSVLLAGILLKMGGYGFVRFVVPLLKTATEYFTPFLFALSTLAVLYTSLTAIRQIDLKKIIAYASVSHMNIVVLGLFNYSVVGFLGSIFLMLSHGIVSSGLFFCVGVLYDRYHTRLLKYFGGLVFVMPIYAVCFFILILSNFSFPGTSNFVGEVLVMYGLVTQNFFCTFFSLLSIVFTLLYSIWLYNRIFFGRLQTKYLIKFADVSYREFFILLSCVGITIFLGIYPYFLLSKMEWVTSKIVYNGI